MGEGEGEGIVVAQDVHLTGRVDGSSSVELSDTEGAKAVADFKSTG